ncbi:hypothetical protein PHYPSEUDO_006760 [Phytophthora pseudosyringae]|uniref:Uncharacterized protein n=1 Tax=Phytophthora pseudosyringae TaxID=221518 RepID=A0A8T1VKV6_9STRA|nr:hypothetical protein PHYPSEUDO_006760 [Phytophthora pseudosyringae]
MFRVLLFFQAHYPNIFTPAFVESARDSVSGRAAKPNDAHILDWLKHNYHVSDVTEEQVDRRFDHLADQILGNIAQQVAGQLGGAVRVVRGHPVAGQPGPNAVLGMMMNNAVMVAHHDNGGDEDDDA